MEVNGLLQLFPLSVKYLWPILACRVVSRMYGTEQRETADRFDLVLSDSWKSMGKNEFEKKMEQKMEKNELDWGLQNGRTHFSLPQAMMPMEQLSLTTNHYNYLLQLISVKRLFLPGMASHDNRMVFQHAKRHGCSLLCLPCPTSRSNQQETSFSSESCLHLFKLDLLCLHLSHGLHWHESARRTKSF